METEKQTVAPTETTRDNAIEGEVLERHTEQDERDFLNGLDDDFDPTVADTKEQQAELENEAAAGMVFIGMMTIEQTMKTMVHKDFKFDPDQAESVANKVAPLIVKYGGNPPPWLAKYMDEIMAVAAIGMLGISSFMQIKHLKAEDRKAEQAKRESKEPNGTEGTA